MASKLQKAKMEATSLSNRTIPMQLDRIVIMINQHNYKEALKEVEYIKSQLKVLEENLEDLNQS